MNLRLLTLTLLVTAKSAFAYGPSPVLIASQNFQCTLRTANGAILLPTLTRTLSESRRVANQRTLRSELLLGDGTGMEQGTGNIDQLLSSKFGRAGYDQSSLSVELESETSGTNLQMEPLGQMTKSMQTAWVSRYQDDLTVTAKIVPESANALELNVVFTLAQQSVSLKGMCLAK